MYDILYDIVGHAYQSGDSYQQYFIYGSIVLIIVLTTVFIDRILGIFRHFWRGGK